MFATVVPVLLPRILQDLVGRAWIGKERNALKIQVVEAGDKPKLSDKRLREERGGQYLYILILISAFPYICVRLSGEAGDNNFG